MVCYCLKWQRCLACVASVERVGNWEEDKKEGGLWFSLWSKPTRQLSIMHLPRWEHQKLQEESGCSMPSTLWLHQGSVLRVPIKSRHVFRASQCCFSLSRSIGTALQQDQDIHLLALQSLYAWKSPNRLWVNSPWGHKGERNNCFSKIQLVGQKYRE